MKQAPKKCVFTIVAAAAMMPAAVAQSVMTHHVRAAALNGHAQPLGRLAATRIMQLDIVLPLRDQAGLDAFLSELHDRYSSNYRHFLTPAEFTERFGPTQQDYDAVVRYVQEYGLEVVGGERSDLAALATGARHAVADDLSVAQRGERGAWRIEPARQERRPRGRETLAVIGFDRSTQLGRNVANSGMGWSSARKPTAHAHGPGRGPPTAWGRRRGHTRTRTPSLAATRGGFFVARPSAASREAASRRGTNTAEAGPISPRRCHP